jgi:uncharacterized membrane protein
MSGWIKGALMVTLIAGYALASHLALTLPNGQAVATALALGIPSLAVTGFIMQWCAGRLAPGKGLEGLSPGRFLTVALLAVLPVLLVLWITWPLLLANAQALYFAQHVGTNALLAWVFGHTLMAGSTPLVVAFARMVHPVLPPGVEAYARKVTAGWTLFFLVTCVISAVLFFAAPLAMWSAFAVLLQWPSVVVFFVGEYLLRRRLFRNMEHASLKQGFDAYNRHQSSAEPSVRAPKP